MLHEYRKYTPNSIFLSVGLALFSGIIAVTYLAGCSNYVSNSVPDKGLQPAKIKTDAVRRPESASTGYSLVYSFLAQAENAEGPAGPLTDHKGVLYGTTLNYYIHACPSCETPGTVFELTVGSQVSEQVIFRFPATSYSYEYAYDGAYPGTGVIAGPDGALYGTAYEGGEGCVGYQGCGTLFKLTPPPSGSGLWSIQVLHYFKGNPKGDGASPSGPLLMIDGVLYGVTQSGGGNCQYQTCGTIYSYNTGTSAYTILHKFGSSGYYPGGPLVSDSDGKLYGTALYGGASCNVQAGCGAIYTISQNGTGYATIYKFTGSSNSGDGAEPATGVTLLDGDIYGTTANGGATTTCPGGCGAIFKLTPKGSGYQETILESFPPAQGVSSEEANELPSGLVSGGNGLLYGTTSKGGDCNKQNFAGGCGTLFSISTGGSFQVVHQFQGPHNDAADPVYGTPDNPGTAIGGGTPAAKQGTLWGATRYGGSGLCAGGGCGAVYMLSLGSGSRDAINRKR